jgi:2-keto-4-pentenoate hydratase
MRARGNAAHDERLDDGMRTQRGLVVAAEQQGAEQTGWKAGMGGSPWRERFALDAPLIGALLDRTRLQPGSEVAIGTWHDARAEAEIAVMLGADVPPDATPEQAMAAVSALTAAIELADVHPLPKTPSEALSGNIFHRHWIVGAFLERPIGHTLSGLVADITAMGEDLDPVHDVEAATGPAAETLAEVARIGARHGRMLRRGDVVILGALVPPVRIAPGGIFRHSLRGYDTIEVRFTA